MGEVIWSILLLVSVGYNFWLWRENRSTAGEYRGQVEESKHWRAAYEGVRAQLDEKALTQAAQKAQSTVKLNGPSLRKLADRVNITVPEPTQAERLNSNG